MVGIVKLRPKLKLVAAVAVSLVLACTRASTPLRAPLGKPLAIATAPTSTPRGFAVAFAGPTGETAPESEIQVLFSRPLRALTTLAAAATPPIQLRPAVEGKWRWLGTQALVFSPARQRLPFATEIAVEIPAETLALDGTRLGTAYTFSLSTPAPKLVNVEPSDDGTHLRANSQFVLSMDQPVSLEQLRSRLRLEVTTAERSETCPFVLALLSEAKKDQGFRLIPNKPLPRAAAVRLAVAKGLVGLEGPRATSAEQSREFTTIAPLRVEKVDCDHATPQSHCDARSGIDLEFNNPVPLRSLRPQLTIDGKRAKLASWHSDDEVTSYVHLPGPFRAGSSVMLRVAGGTKDDFGQLLEQPHQARVVFDDYQPKMEVGLRGDVFEIAQPPTIPIGVVNVERYERLYLPLTVDALAGLLTADDSDELFTRGLARPGARVDWQSPKVARNQMGVEAFDPASKFGPLLGAGMIAVRYPGIDREGNAVSLTDARIVQRTNLGISGQVGRHASVIWVTELDTGRSVQGAEVQVVQADGKSCVHASTDEQGLVRFGADAIGADAIEQPWKHPAVIVATRGADLAYRRISDILPEWRIPVSVDRAGQLGNRLMLFTERGLYRPGERVDVKAILRDEQPRGLGLPKQRAISFDLVSPDNHAVASKTMQLSGFGTTAAHFAVPLAATTGQWSMRARLGKDTIGSTDLTVGEFRPVELEVSVLPDQAEMLRGGKLAVQVRSQTLFGMAAAGAKVRLEAYRERTSFAPLGTEAYATGADDFDEPQRNDNFQRAQLLLSQRELDQQGRTDAVISAELPAARGPSWIHVEAEVSDASQNPVTATARTMVHPAAFYVGLRRLTDAWVTAPGKLPIDVAAFSPEGSRQQGRLVALELLRRKWSVVRREVNGVVESKNEASDEVLGRCQVRSAAVDAHCVFDVPRAGSYYVVARGKDDANRVAMAAQSFFAVGAGQLDIADEDDRRIDLVPDKAEYRVGDVAKVLVKSAITDVDALVVVGRSEAHLAERRHLTGQTPILEIPIREDMRPNMFVMVELVTGRKRPPTLRLEQPDLGAPTYRMGWAELKIGSADRRLTVEVKPSTRLARPGASVELVVTLRDAAARPVRGEVTLWAVDEGVLALGNYSVPDPYQIFLGSRPLQLLPVESRESLGRRTLASMREELGLTKGSPGSGGGESGSSSPLRQDFRATAFFVPDLVTDPLGRAKATLRLPDGLTSYRVFAVAVTGTEQYGFASDRIVTSKSVMARPTLPRFFRRGDRAEIGVVVSSRDAPDGDVAVALSAGGLLPKQQQQHARLARGGSVELFFPLEATNEQTCSVTVEAALSGSKDSVKLTRPLRYSIPSEVVAQAGETRELAREQLGDLTQVRAEQGYLELQLSSSFLGGTAGGFQQLVEYPYGCSEQISSRLMALLPLADLARSASIELPKDRERMVEVAIAELLRRQRHDGGFGMWPEAAWSEPWVSAHVLAALNDAKRDRAYLAAPLERGVEYLRALASDLTEQKQDRGSVATLTYVADVLLRLGQGDPGLLSRLFAVRRELPPFAQAMLLHAYALSHHDAKATAELRSELERLLHQDGALARVTTNVGDDYARLFDSNTRTAATVTWALAAAQPEHPLLVPLARGLLAERRNGRWNTTQDSAFALLALDAVRRAKHLSSDAIEAKVMFGERAVFAGAIGGKLPALVTRRIGMDELRQSNAPLSFETQHGPLLYEARLNYVPNKPASLAIDSGFALERGFVPVSLDGTAEVSLTPTAATEPCVIRAVRGQMFVVEFTVVVPRPRDFVVLDAPLPAGFEAVDVTQQTSGGWLRRLDRVQAIGPDGGSNIAYHRDLRDDRVAFLVDHFPVGLYRLRHLARAVTRGTFAVPPARVEAMYAPEHFGTTPACVVEIR
jgi:alpha-2-macroglobulin